MSPVHGNTQTGIISGLFPNSKAAVIGLPADFAILGEIEKADYIRLVMAFCHLSGWKKLEPAVKECKGIVRLITGLDFFQTEPTLLRTWNRLAIDPRFRPRIMTSASGTFHPKVLVVSTSTAEFALVGSGNLSDGGLRANIECFVYTSDENHVRQLREWFDDLFQQAQDFTEDDIRDYEIKYRTIHRAVAKIHTQQRALEAALKSKHVAFLANWQQAVSQAKQWFHKPDFNDGWKKRKHAIDRMKRLLHYPMFDFSRQGWTEFYSVLELGHLIPIYRDRVFRKETLLKQALRMLVDENKPIGERLSAVLDRRGSHRIPGLRLNTVSKILAIHDSSKWPVYNSPVESTLREFGYTPPRGVGMAGRYEAFAKLMQDFMKECAAKDVCALDWFFYWFAQEKKPTKQG